MLAALSKVYFIAGDAKRAKHTKNHFMINCGRIFCYVTDDYASHGSFDAFAQQGMRERRVKKFSALTPKMHALIVLQRKFMLSPGDVQCGQNNIAIFTALYFALCPLRYKLQSRWPNGHCYPSAKVFKVVHRCVVLASWS